MTSYNRVGAVASSANRGLMVNILRKEWGFKGYNVTDFTGVSAKAAPKESIMAGTVAFCGFGKPSVDYWDETTLKGDAAMGICRAAASSLARAPASARGVPDRRAPVASARYSRDREMAI